MRVRDDSLSLLRRRAGTADQDECEGVQVFIDEAAFPVPAEGDLGPQRLKVGLQSKLELLELVWFVYLQCIVLCRGEVARAP